MVVARCMMCPMYNPAFGVIHIFAIKSDFVARLQRYFRRQINIVRKQQYLLCIDPYQKLLMTRAFVVSFKQFDYNAFTANLYITLPGFKSLFYCIIADYISGFCNISC